MRSVAACQYILLQQARDRQRDGRATHVLDCEVVLCEDLTACMVYLYFGLPGDDACGVDVEDIAAVYYDLAAPISEDAFDARAAAAEFTHIVQQINSGLAHRVL